MAIPNDPMILLSYLNTQLRDNDASFDAFCKRMDCDAVSIREKISAIGYEYDTNRNQFVAKRGN